MCHKIWIKIQLRHANLCKGKFVNRAVANLKVTVPVSLLCRVSRSFHNGIQHISISEVSFLKSETLLQLSTKLQEEVYHQFRIYCSLHNCTIVFDIYLFQLFHSWIWNSTSVVTLIRVAVPSVQNLLQFAQLYCYTQETFISTVSFLKFEALTGVVTLIRGGVPSV